MKNPLLCAAVDLAHLADMAGTPLERTVHADLVNLCEKYSYEELMPALMLLVEDSVTEGGGVDGKC